MVIKGAVIVFALVSLLALIMYCVVIAIEEDDRDILSDDDLAEERSRYACYEDGEIDE